LKNKYQHVVFGDSDDYFEENRIEKSIDLLKQYDIVVNDLSLFNETGLLQENYISNRVDNSTVIDIDFIKNKNIFGFTNTAINLRGLDVVSFNSELIAVDWYFFSNLLLDGAIAVFSSETVTYYRQHDNSLIGLGSSSPKALNLARKVRDAHFRALGVTIEDYSLNAAFGNKGIRIKDECLSTNLFWWERECSQ